MVTSSIELLLVAIACSVIAFTQYKKANDKRRRLTEKDLEEITYLDVVLLVAGFAIMSAAVVFTFQEYRQNGLSDVTLFVGFKWSLAAIVVKEAKSIHRALRPLLRS